MNAVLDDAEPVWMDFLNADGRPLEAALGRRLEVADDGGLRTLVLCQDAERAAALNAGLWAFDQASFLPHGGAGDGASDDHPIWVGTEETDEARGRLVVVDGAEPADWDSFAARAYLFDARDPAARDAARARWREWADAGRALAYWSFDGGAWRMERRT